LATAAAQLCSAPALLLPEKEKKNHQKSKVKNVTLIGLSPITKENLKLHTLLKVEVCTPQTRQIHAKERLKNTKEKKCGCFTFQQVPSFTFSSASPAEPVVDHLLFHVGALPNAYMIF
jgi:hypothetical protein